MSLETATTEELLNELESRCTASVIMLVLIADQRDEHSTQAKLRWSGDFYSALGLAEIARDDMLRANRDS